MFRLMFLGKVKLNIQTHNENEVRLVARIKLQIVLETNVLKIL